MVKLLGGHESQFFQYQGDNMATQYVPHKLLSAIIMDESFGTISFNQIVFEMNLVSFIHIMLLI